MQRAVVYFGLLFVTLISSLPALIDIDLGLIELRIGKRRRATLTSRLCSAVAGRHPVMLTVVERENGDELMLSRVVLNPYAVGRDAQGHHLLVGVKSKDKDSEVSEHAPAHRKLESLGKIRAVASDKGLKAYSFYNVIQLDILEQRHFTADPKFVNEIDKKLVNWSCRIQ